MTAGYLERHDHARLPAQPCFRHSVHTYGVLDQAGVLRAYALVYRAGELVLVSMILGHGDHLANDVMYLLMQGLVEEQAPAGGIIFYNRHDSGTEGLRYFKERCGFLEHDLEWAA